MVGNANRESQRDEICAVTSIFPEHIEVEAEHAVVLKFSQPIEIRLSIDLPQGYPNECPPSYSLSGPELSGPNREFLERQLNEAWNDSPYQPIIFTWANVIIEFLQDRHKPDDLRMEGGITELEDDSESPSTSQGSCSSTTMENKKHTIFHGESFTDRKSHFQAHLAPIKSEAEAREVMSQLLENGKVARATHNIYAFRVKETRKGREILLQDCEDDGETKAASKILEIMIRMEALNVIVVVSRWYGGIHLGPDRFRHINNLAREILTEHGYDKKSPK
ncbi:hypothetical protein WR25_07117 [Diploscapter pachys]|uniref:RWD domain-containing protein n=1 Tax=Diploscapter pachys TaxID=2018661 RepID=A0A2A2JF57_9BILA|nr:hypothetical protein WR25_07117 [Diploscapter pachys]